jgi:hypothetical protein
MKITDYCLDDYRVIPNTTTCKHKDGDCELCGTSNKRDVLHDTQGGVGKVGALIKKSKKK